MPNFCFGADMNKQREKWLDALRGMAMLIVIWGHSGKNYFYNWIYLINVPLFICITGYIYGFKFYNHRDVTINDFYKVIKGRVFQYFTYGIMVEIISYIETLMGFNVRGKQKIDSLFAAIYDFFQFDVGTIWFLIPLAFSEFIFLLFLLAFKIIWKNKRKLWYESLLICLMALGLSGIWGSQNFYNIIELRGEWSVLLFHWNYAILRSFIFMYFLGVGSLAFCVIKKYKDSRITNYVLGSICIILFIVFYKPDSSYFMEARWVSYINQIPYIVKSSLGCFALFMFFCKLRFHTNFLQYVGKNTMIINGTHLAFNLVELSNRWVQRQFNGMLSPLVKSLLILFLVVVMEIIIIVPLFHKSLKFMDDYDCFRNKINSCWEKVKKKMTAHYFLLCNFLHDYQTR